MKSNIARRISPALALIGMLCSSRARAEEPSPPMTPYTRAVLDCWRVDAAAYLRRKAGTDPQAKAGTYYFDADEAKSVCRADPVGNRTAFIRQINEQAQINALARANTAENVPADGNDSPAAPMMPQDACIQFGKNVQAAALAKLGGQPLSAEDIQVVALDKAMGWTLTGQDTPEDSDALMMDRIAKFSNSDVAETCARPFGLGPSAFGILRSVVAQSTPGYR